MRPTTPASAPLVPTLPDVLNKRVRHDLTTLRGGDQLHTMAPLLGFPKGAALPVYGCCTHVDEAGQAYAVRAYVRPFAATEHAVAFAERDAQRYPTPGQREQWFEAYLLLLVEIDLTDYADLLRLERQPEAVAQLLSPTLRLAA